jgi:hypothetical protein
LSETESTKTQVKRVRCVKLETRQLFLYFENPCQKDDRKYAANSGYGNDGNIS